MDQLKSAASSILESEDIAISSTVDHRESALEELRFKSLLLDLVTDSLFIHDFDGKMLYVNQSAYKTRGYTRDELLALPLKDLDTPECAARVPERIEELLEKGSIMFESAHFRKDGTVMNVEIHSRLVDFGGNQLVLSVARDITQRQEAEKALLETSNRLQAIMDNATAVIFVKTLEGKYLQVNHRFRSLFHVERENIAGKTDYDLFPRDVAERVRFNDRQVITADSAMEIEEEVPQKDGMHTYLCTKFLLRSHDGVPYAVCGIATDITERKQAELLSHALNEIDAAINSTLDFERIMSRVVVEAARAVQADSAMGLMLEDDNWVTRYVYRLPRKDIGAKFSDSQVPAVSSAAKTREAVIKAVSSPRRSDPGGPGPQSQLAVPLIARNQIIGVLVFNRTSQRGVFNHAHADFGAKLAPAVSLALENAHLYEAERDIADTLQKALLVAPQKIEGINFGHIYRSATEAAKVGGDFYDLFELEHGRVGIAIGDVSGKGLEAATLTSLVKNTIRAYSYQEADPASIMSKTNEVLLRNSAPGIFVTVFFGILDTTSGHIVYCAAGHPPAIVRRADGRMTTLTTDSPAVGLKADLLYRNCDETLRPGDVMTLYTDGITEARRGNKFYGERRLARLIKGLDGDGCAKLPRSIIQAVMEFTGGTLSDDVALLTVTLRRS